MRLLPELPHRWNFQVNCQRCWPARVYLGAKTGRDGVGGATMASAEFDENIEEKRPTVQVGDPFTEKCLLEACMELMATGLSLLFRIWALQV